MAHPHVNVEYFVLAHRSHDQWHNNGYVILKKSESCAVIGQSPFYHPPMSKG